MAKKPRKRLLVAAAIAALVVGFMLAGLLLIGREELKFVQIQELTQKGRGIDEWHASFQRFAQQPVQVGKVRFGYRRWGGGQWIIEEHRDGAWVERPLASAEFRYYSDPTIRVPKDLTNKWRLKITSPRLLIVGFGTNEWTLGSTRSTLRSETLASLPDLKTESRAQEALVSKTLF